ncbi:unnamed protein product [Bathycoccus prasinos]
MFSLSAAQFASTASSASLRSSQKSTKKSVRSSSMIVKNTASMDELDSTTTSSSSSDMVDIDSAMQRAESPTMNNGQTYSENKPETFKEIMGFAGWAPEVINCRAGMVAFVAAMGAEMQSYNHETFGAQLHDHVFSLVFASLLITAASFMPSMQNAEKYTSKPSSKPYGIFTPEAEITNGRMAIIGLVAATVAEKVMGHGIFA